MSTTMLKDKYSKIVGGTANLEKEAEDLVSTGFDLLDSKLKGGLRYGCCYLFSGLEKSGKSSFLFNIINNRIQNSMPVGILSTEMEMADLSKRLLSIAGLEKAPVKERNDWKDKLDMFLHFYGRDELTVQTPNGYRHEFPKFINALDELSNLFVDFVIVDNLTTLGAEAGDYMTLGSYTNKLNTYVKNKSMAVIYVVHIKPTVSYKETEKGVRSMVKQGKLEEFMEEAVTVVGRPTLNDVYGGGQAHSQISGGAIMLWRPFQKFPFVGYQRMGKIIIDTHRYGPSGDISCEYDGEKGTFKLFEKESK